ncbi:hypothetical protein GYMLUDRAFT_77911 [Collybiopsis luxurians FD-317 M1]|uniref:rRNA methyltransferase 2, mitochondrial n=1 Tax=Collybiopsis luxurians FD-317 M1 TaxID=944289 RepID=A0A0D0CBC2_9AGAR|nr:hypothetical protein GYMLUDRAFT_77911 [Collybiopsis luxurians FD-317 M1]
MPLRLAFRPSSPSYGSKTKKSSTEWLRRQSQDPFVKQRASSLSAFRSRSAFKLVEMHEKFDEFLTKPDVRAIVDLGAAPGGWSQVVSQLINEPKQSQAKPKSISRSASSSPLEFYDPLNIDADLERLFLESSSGSKPKVKIIAVDRLSMDSVTGVSILKADFLHPQTEGMIRALIDNPSHSSSLSHSRSSPPKLGLSNPDPPKVDIVLSDIAPNMTGVPAVDSEANLQVAHAVFQFVEKYLRSAEDIGRAKGGVLVLKHFAHPTMDAFRRTVLEPRFQDVIFIKPKASRQESSEGYFLCRGYGPPQYW